MRGLDVLEDALNTFRRETGLTADRELIETRITDRVVDATIKIEGPRGVIEYLVEIKPTLAETMMGQLIHQFKGVPGKWLVVTQYVPMQLAKKMKDLGMQFIDTAGNAYIDDPPLKIFMCGNRPAKKLTYQMNERYIGMGGIRILFTLLCRPDLENATYREIAEAAGTALGTVAGVMKDLDRNGFLIELGAGRKRLIRKKELAEKWTRMYAEKFRNRKLIGRFTAFRPNFWEDIQLGNLDALWGGEVAANKLTHYLKPAIFTLYTHKPIEKLLLNLKLRKDENGPVELREKFWGFTTLEPVGNIVPPFLVYADLLATADPRNIETANMVYDQYLKRYFQ